MSDLARIEALAGPLPKGRAYEEWLKKWSAQADHHEADAALAEAYAAIERLARLLNRRYPDLEIPTRKADVDTWRGAS